MDMIFNLEPVASIQPSLTWSITSIPALNLDPIHMDHLIPSCDTSLSISWCPKHNNILCNPVQYYDYNTTTDATHSHHTTSRLASHFIVTTTMVLHIWIELVSTKGGIAYLNVTPLPREDSGGLLVKVPPSKGLLWSINWNRGDGMQRRGSEKEEHVLYCFGWGGFQTSKFYFALDWLGYADSPLFCDSSRYTSKPFFEHNYQKSLL